VTSNSLSLPAILLTGLLAVSTLNAAEVPSQMRAVVVRDGAVAVEQVNVPAVNPGEVLVRIRAAAVNPVDTRITPEAGRGPGGPPPGAPGRGDGPGRGGRGGPPAQSGPNIPGFDASGTIAALGEGVSGWSIGSEVIAFSDRRGAYAEYVSVPASAIVAKPAALSFESAAGIPTVAYAAWAVLVDIVNVKAGDRVLVHGSSGGTGSAAVQIAKARGAWVIATASAQNHDYVRSLGADEMIDYRSERFEDRAKDIDIVFNNVDTDTANRSISVVRPGGIIVSITGTIDQERVAAAGIRYSGRMPGGTPVGEMLGQVAQLAVEGRYDVNVDSTFLLDQVNTAWDRLRNGSPRGKIILTLP
jgi:NADPH:quinone reductase-like Zn-dependent oxidoreductase